jgi:hypothetical protein
MLGRYDMQASALRDLTGASSPHGNVKLAVYSRINSYVTTGNVLAVAVLALTEITKYIK